MAMIFSAMPGIVPLASGGRPRGRKGLLAACGGALRRLECLRRRRGARQAPGAVVALRPVSKAHVLGADAGAGARRVDEPVRADVDADVRERPLERVEEDEVARL